MPTQASKNGLVPFVCQDTGIELKIRHIPFTVTDRFFEQYEKDHAAPEPPTQTVDYGEGEKIKEKNHAHPAYLKRAERYEIEKTKWCDQQAKKLYTDLAIECDVDTDAVKQLRAEMRALGVALDPDDKFVYVWHIAIGTVQGHNELMQAIQRRTQPTEEAIAQAKQSFRGEVQGA